MQTSRLYTQKNRIWDTRKLKWIIEKMTQCILIFRSHHFQVKPLSGIDFPMVCEPEPTNDIWAVVVKTLTEIMPLERQTAGQILGKTKGHVLKHICNVISINK